MANKAKAKGTTFETAVKKYLEANGITSRRTALSGAKDTGDLEITEPFLAIVEAKAYKSALTEGQEKEFRSQTEVEQVNYKEAFRITDDIKGLLVTKSTGQSIARSRVQFYSKRYNCWIETRLSDFVEHWKEMLDDIR